MKNFSLFSPVLPVFSPSLPSPWVPDATPGANHRWGPPELPLHLRLGQQELHGCHWPPGLQERLEEGVKEAEEGAAAPHPGAQAGRPGDRPDQAAPGCAEPPAEPEKSGKLWRGYRGEGQRLGESRGTRSGRRASGCAGAASQAVAGSGGS